ncbi:MAG: hypothetical protein HY976_00115, partial [Candidatus Kerfeldbacteria bacterium]|nr:hypothetical protein [Candidatus Kerfeldbacteria bacterium]
LLLYATLRRRLGDLDDDRIIRTIGRVVLASALMALLVQGVKATIVNTLHLNIDTGVGILTQLLVAGGLGTIAYLSFATALRLDEVAVVRQWLSRARQQLTNGRPVDNKPDGT